MVEDDEDDYILAQDTLSDMTSVCVQLDWCDTFESGLQAIARGEHDLYFLDYRLGAQNGLDLLRQAAAQGCTRPVILMTGQDQGGMDLEAMRAGAADYLVKGQFTAPMLERCIRYALERARTLESLRLSEERYARACAGANDGLWDWDLQQNVLYLSSRWKEMLGFREAEVGELPEEWLSRIHPADLRAFQMALAAHLEGRTPHFEWECRVLHRDGDYRWMLIRGLAVCDLEGRRQRMAGSQSDITARKRAEEQLLHSAFHDTLTGLPNRALFMDRLGRAMTRRPGYHPNHYAVLFLDVNRFKVVNDSLGHPVGDQLLCVLADRLRQILRSCDTVARLGGDEFTVLLEDINGAEDATSLAERIYQEIALPIRIENHDIVTSVSIGVVVGPCAYERPEEVLRDADAAMYRCKSQYGLRYQIFDPALQTGALDLLSLENELRRAVERNELVVHYQPVVRVDTQHVSGFEALVRWQHPTRGLILPGEFIQAAEETGQIVPIGHWVLREACRQLQEWGRDLPEADRLWMSVNISPRQFGLRNLVQHVQDALQDHGLAANRLRLEITESTVMQDPEGSINTLEHLHSLGVNLSLDDFGIGHSSLSYLQRFPVSTLKIDRSFIHRMCERTKDLELVRVIVLLARTLGLRVVAEGVETADQRDRLNTLQCDFAQGFLFSRPLAPEAATQLLCRELLPQETGEPRRREEQPAAPYRPPGGSSSPDPGLPLPWRRVAVSLAGSAP